METELLNTVVKQNKTVANATDPYNIFSVLSIETKEVLICRVIGDFLNPRGKHGENSKFLSLFLKEIPELQHIACEQLDQAIVTTEYVIDENRRIDIVSTVPGLLSVCKAARSDSKSAVPHQIRNDARGI